MVHVPAIDRARSLLQWLAWAAGIALVVVLIRRVGWETVVRSLSRVGPRIFWVLGAYFAATVLVALPWRGLMARASRPSWGAAVASRFAASGMNALLPLVGAGEVSRLLWTRRPDWAEATAALVLDRMLFALACAVSLAAGAVATFFLPPVPKAFATVAAVVAFAITVSVAVGMWIAARGAPVAFVRRSLRRFKQAIGRLPAGSEPELFAPHQIDAALNKALAGPKRPLLTGIVLHLCGRGFLTLEFYLALRALDIKVGLATVLVMAAIPIALSVVGAIIPSQLGLQEGMQAIVAAALGLGATAGVSLVLLQRARQIVFLPLTALMFLARPYQPTRTQSPQRAHLSSPPST